MNSEKIKSYWSHEIAIILDVSTSTLRKWSIALEKERYIFIRDKNDKRAYLECDILPLRKMHELLSGGMDMKNAAKSVSLRFSEQMLNKRTTDVLLFNDHSSDRYFHLISQIETIQKENIKLHKNIQDISKQINLVKESTDNKLDVLLSRVKTCKKYSWWKFWNK
jgi:DNA-binding transcriptional MerR regulator